MGVRDFLEEVEGWDWWTKRGELTVFEPDMVEVYKVSVTEAEDMDFLEHLLSITLYKKGYSVQVFVIISDGNLMSVLFMRVRNSFNSIVTQSYIVKHMSYFEYNTTCPSSQL